MKEWDPDSAMKMIKSLLLDEVEEDKLYDDECEALAAKIVAALEEDS